MIKNCSDFIQQCMAGKGVKDCHEFMGSPDFWSITEKEVKQMNPAMAVNFLKSFGFHPITVYNGEKGMNLVQMPTIEKWLTGLSKDL